MRPSSTATPTATPTAIAALLLAAACVAGPQTSAATATAKAAPAAHWSYDVHASPGASELTVTASYVGETDSELTVEDGAEPYVADVDEIGAHGARRLEARGGSWFLREPCRPECVVRYRYRLHDAARARDEVAVARLVGDAIEAPPSTWLLRPARAPHGTPFRYRVTTAEGDTFVSGVFPDPDAPGTFAGATDSMYQLAYSAFGRMRVRDLHGGRVQLAILPGPSGGDETIASWVESSARAVEAYYGTFPVRRLLVLARPTGGRSAGFGTTMGHSGAAISIDVGAGSSPADLATDWVLVHEMVHTALPDLEGPQHWLEEGLATYVEPLARRRAGLRTSERVWAEWIEGMPNGLPEAGDRGLDATPTWGRTYWGGALFCLLADVEIRRRTNNARSIDDALRAILAAGGSIAQSWPVERVLELGDRATGVPVLREQYLRMAHSPAPVDLGALWKSLGVSKRGGAAVFDDSAPLAAVRRGITGD